MTAVQFGIDAIFGQQLRMCALLYDASGLYNTYDVGVLHGGQAMGYHNAGAAGAGRIQCLLHYL